MVKGTYKGLMKEDDEFFTNQVIVAPVRFLSDILKESKDSNDEEKTEPKPSIRKTQDH